MDNLKETILTDSKIAQLQEMIGRMRKHMPDRGESLRELEDMIKTKCEETEMLLHILEKINEGVVLEEVLNYTYESLRSVIPYSRIGFSLLHEEGRIVRAHWARSESQNIRIGKDYEAEMKGSSLQGIIETGQPRILNDLEAYLKDHSNSDSTQRIIEEGMRSSLTCPLVALGKPIGFMFFSSMQPNAYKNAHVEFFMQIAKQLSVIAEKSRLYEELEIKNKALQRLDQLKSDFVSTVSHELRTPIAITTEGLSLVIEGVAGPITEKQASLLTTSKENIDRLTKIINDLLDISKIEAGRLELRRGMHEINDVLNRLIDSYQRVVAKKKINLTLDLPDEAILLYVDKDKIIQTITNLLNNATKFTSEGGQIGVSVFKKESDVVIAVRDTGRGIASEDMGKLFNKFQQFGRTAGPGIKGTGLGLSITKALVELHGGKITAESTVGVGTTFFITLPNFEKIKTHSIEEIDHLLREFDNTTLLAAQFVNSDQVAGEFGEIALREVMNEVIEIIREKISTPQGKVFLYDYHRVVVLLPETDKINGALIARRLKHVITQYKFAHEKKQITPNIKFGVVEFPLDADSQKGLLNKAQEKIAKTKTVLIVDDEASIVDVLKIRLESKGYQTRCAANGHEALQSIQQQQPDLVVLDLMMPTVDGYQVYERLQESPQTAHIPIVLLTAQDVDPKKIKLEMVPVVSKTEGFENVIKIVDELL